MTLVDYQRCPLDEECWMHNAHDHQGSFHGHYWMVRADGKDAAAECEEFLCPMAARWRATEFARDTAFTSWPL